MALKKKQENIKTETHWVLIEIANEAQVHTSAFSKSVTTQGYMEKYEYKKWHKAKEWPNWMGERMDIFRSALLHLIKHILILLTYTKK